MKSMSNQEIAEAMRNHHALMAQQLHTLAGHVVTQKEEWGTARNEVGMYLTDDILPHAAAEELTIYRVAAQVDSMKGLIDSMLFEHGVIREIREKLMAASMWEEAVTFSTEAAKLFEIHAEKENRFIIAVLEPRSDVDLASVLGDMHHLLSR
jgi:hemerythrin-like domain-containing protein